MTKSGSAGSTRSLKKEHIQYAPIRKRCVLLKYTRSCDIQSINDTSQEKAVPCSSPSTIESETLSARSYPRRLRDTTHLIEGGSRPLRDRKSVAGANARRLPATSSRTPPFWPLLGSLMDSAACRLEVRNHHDNGRLGGSTCSNNVSGPDRGRLCNVACAVLPVILTE